jgi:hypothetical protein
VTEKMPCRLKCKRDEKQRVYSNQSFKGPTFASVEKVWSILADFLNATTKERTKVITMTGFQASNALPDP